MIFIADSGATKTDWRALDKGKVIASCQTRGFNPNQWGSEGIIEELNKEFVKKMPVTTAKKIFFYGSGCSDSKRKSIISQALKVVFPKAKFDIQNDILGAAHATCGNEKGIVCILGTGSNSCLYNGIVILDQVANLGYLIGDEGSGYDLGKRLVQSYFYREMPVELSQEFKKLIPKGRTELIDNLYKRPTPNLYLSKFTKFMHLHRKHEFIEHLIHMSFTIFLRRHVAQYEGNQDYPVHFVGSIAYYFQEQLIDTLDELGFEIGEIIQSPIDGLEKYHLQKKGKGRRK